MHATLKTTLKALAAVSLAALAASPALAAATIVNVTLLDDGADAEMGTDLGMTMPGDAAKAVMRVIADKQTVPAGEVTFVALNKSAEIVHEMLVVKVADLSKPLPYVDGDARVDEDAAGHLGEVSELDPGKSGSLTLSLEPGTYMLFCNIPGHYMAGMWTMITVS